MYKRLHVKYLLFLSDLNETGIFSTGFRKISNSMQILLVGAELFRADRQTDRYDKANSWFRNFAKAPNRQTARHVNLATHLIPVIDEGMQAGV
jgi:hypothetical protein